MRQATPVLLLLELNTPPPLAALPRRSIRHSEFNYRFQVFDK